MKKNLKLIIFLCTQFAIVLAIILIVLFAGKKTYTVTFNINGGNHISGELVQTVRYGKSATPPVVTKDGCYLLRWNQQYDIITKDVTITAIWEYETSYGVEIEVIPNSNYCVISGCYENVSGDIYVGSFYQGKKVLGIKSEAFKDCKYITGIYLLDGILSIGDNAFSGCTNLKSIVIPSTVETIGKSIFANCNKLEGISIPFIGDSIYDNSYPFLGYLFGGTNYSTAYLNVPSTLGYVDITNNYDIPDFAFFKCSKIDTIKIFGKVEKIGNNAFRNCKSLVNIQLPSSIKYIGDAAFANCSSLKTMTLPNLLENLNSAVFANCTALEKVTIEANLKSIAENAFQNCTKLKEFEIIDNDNFMYLNEKLFIKEGNAINECVIISDKYKDEISDFPTFVINPEIGPAIKDPNLEIGDIEKEDGFIGKDELFPVE